MKTPPNNPMKDLHRLLSKKDFQSQEELQAFLESLTGKPLPMMHPEDLTPQEQAEDLAEEAMGLPPAQAKKKLEQALKLDPESITVYSVLGRMESSPQSALKYYEKAIAIGRKQFLGENAKMYMGHFWMMTETRPFMRCMYEYAECLTALGTPEGLSKGFFVYEEMLTLNPNDNQGVRDQFMLMCLTFRRFDKFKHYAAQYNDGTAFAYFNKALFTFCLEGDTPASRKELQAAIKHNPFVAPMLTAPMRRIQPPASYSLGSKSEAEYYVMYAYLPWSSTPGAKDWLQANVGASSTAPKATKPTSAPKQTKAGKKK
jgi:tetratricopeptide (TPR) repeat protein